MTLAYNKSENEKIETEMGLNLDEMHFTSKDGGELEFYSVEHLDNS